MFSRYLPLTVQAGSARAPLTLVCVFLLAIAPLGCSDGPDKNDLKRYALSNKFSEAAADKKPEPAPERQPAPKTEAEPAGEGRAAPAPAAARQAPPEATKQAAPAAVAESRGEPEIRVDVETLGPIPSDLSAAGCYARSVENLQRIAEAMRSYSERHGSLPEQGYPRMSWRVKLLPYLGYQELYSRYKQDEDWFSPANQKLLAEIPPEYQSPERRDTRTNYQVVIGGSGIYRERGVGKPNSNGTLFALVEVDDEAAKPWLAPEDYQLGGNDPRGALKSLGALRGEEFLALTGDLRVLALPANLKLIGANFNDPDFAEDPARHGRDLAEIRYAAFAESGAGDTTVSAGGQGASSGSGPAVAGGGSGSRPVASSSRSGFGDACWRAAEVAAGLTHRDESWLWTRGATAAGLRSAVWGSSFQWYPALQRPSLGLQVVVAVPGQPSAANRSRTGSGTRETVAAREAQFRRQAGAVGQRFLREINELIGSSAPPPMQESLQDRPVSQRETGSSTLDYVLDAPNLQQASSRAREIGADVLVYFEFSAASGGRGEQLEVSVYDLFRGKRLLKTDRALVRSSNPASQDRAREGAKRLRWELKDYFEDSLVPQEWPVRMTPRLARRRLETLGSRAGRAMPLVALTEMQHYRQQGLIDDAELLEAVEGVVGKSDALSLVLGDDTKQRRVMREWLPSDDPAEYVALAERRRVVAEDDD